MDVKETVAAAKQYELCALVLENTTTVVRILRGHVARLSYETLQHVEDVVLAAHHRAGEIAQVRQFDCAAQAEAARKEARAFRNGLNSDPTYVRYKMLVGFETVVQPQWEDPEFDFEEIERFRRERMAEIWRRSAKRRSRNGGR